MSGIGRKLGGGGSAFVMLVALGLVAGEASPAAPIGDGRGGAKLTRVASFQAPTHVTRAPGRGNRKLTFVSEQRGVVRVMRGNRVLPRPFIDIQGRVGNSEGLLSIAFDPDYVRNRRLYAFYVDPDRDIRVSQLRRSRQKKTRVRSRPRRVIEIPHHRRDHHGGTVDFGPDGMMYLATGDGGGTCDPDGNAQNRRSLLGKLLRIDPRRRSGYRIPSDNPFAGVRGTRGEIYASGLRNPFRFSFDRRSGTIAIGDVGQQTTEEINYETLAGARRANFGWDAFEGTTPLELDGCDDPNEPTTPPPNRHDEPILEYPHEGPGHSGCSVTAGLTVRDRRLPSLDGRYLYADFCAGQLRSLVPRLDGARADRPLGVAVEFPTSIGLGRGDRIFVTSYNGGLFRLRPLAERSR